MTHRSPHERFLPVVAAAVGAMVIATPASAATLFVANNGTDGPACGAKNAPCRSISRAIANANAGDTLIVGPGRYGDLDGDTDFNDAGEETGPSQACNCTVLVNKRLVILSRDGAATTIVDGTGQSTVVRIVAAGSGTVFGRKRKGFTLRSATGTGLQVDSGVNGATITSNVAIANGGNGFGVFQSNDVVLSSNLAQGNGFGGVGDAGFSIGGSGHVLTGNVATSHDGDGFVVSSGAVLIGNVAEANVNRGFNLSPGDYLLKGNSVINNLGAGIVTGNGSTVLMIKNNVFGNNTVDDFGLTNCGIRNLNGALDASKTFWGAATGPGGDPADDACISGAGTIVTEPFATKETKPKRLP